MSKYESSEESPAAERIWDRVRSVTQSLADEFETDEGSEGAPGGEASDDGPDEEEPSLEELVSVEQPFSREKVLARTGMTPEECVLELVARRDGRMRQSAVVDVTGWSPATVSRILSDMEEAGTIVRFRLGPGKVVFLPDQAPDDVATR